MVRDTISELGAPIGFTEQPLALPVLDTPKQAEQAALEATARKERDELEATFRGEQEKNHTHQIIREITNDITREELEAALRKWEGMDQSKKVFDTYAQQEQKWKEPLEQAKQSDLEAALRKERDELEYALRKEQEKNDIATYAKELHTCLESCGIHTIMTDSEYTTLYTSENRYDKLVEFIQPAIKLQSEYLNCSEYYYNADRNTIFEITTTKSLEKLSSVKKNDVDDRNLRELNGLPLVVTS
jgi:hypothetical protein